MSISDCIITDLQHININNSTFIKHICFELGINGFQFRKALFSENRELVHNLYNSIIQNVRNNAEDYYDNNLLVVHIDHIRCNISEKDIINSCIHSIWMSSFMIIEFSNGESCILYGIVWGTYVFSEPCKNRIQIVYNNPNKLYDYLYENYKDCMCILTGYIKCNKNNIVSSIITIPYT